MSLSMDPVVWTALKTLTKSILYILGPYKHLTAVFRSVSVINRNRNGKNITTKLISNDLSSTNYNNMV